MGVTVRVWARFGQENGVSEGETLERTTRRKHPEEIPKTFKALSFKMIPRTACYPWSAANLVKSWYGH